MSNIFVTDIAEQGKPLAQDKALVIGASGFVGSHVVKALCANQRSVRAMVRRNSNVSALAGLDMEICYGDVLDPDSLQQAMQDCTTVFYCVVDTRAWLDDPAPLFRCNVDGLRNAMEAALANQIQKFIFTSSMVTIGLNKNRKPTEQDPFNWHDSAPDYALSRVQAEDLLFEYCRKRQLPGIALCVANTYGPGDVQPTPHGKLLWAAARGSMQMAMDCGAPWVDIRDAADAMILAETKGIIGERYIIAAGYVTQAELYEKAATLMGNKKPVVMPLAIVYVIAWLTQTIGKLLGKKNIKLRVDSVKLAHVFSDMDNSKAKRELGWQPRPLEETVQDAVQWFSTRRNQRQ
ncbi:MAG TPA: NAD-dependent epimerase/dehydratase family protein [Pseudomonadales bacterium]|nr:NAD-dependent epimerase/dehydratase family protein [Pseudomonadales bacterium]